MPPIKPTKALLLLEHRPDLNWGDAVHFQKDMCTQVLNPSARITLPTTPEQGEAVPSNAKAAKLAGASVGRPDELVPEIAQFLNDHPHIRAVPKAVQVCIVMSLEGIL